MFLLSSNVATTKYDALTKTRFLLDVCCVDLVRDRKWAIIVSPHQGAKDGPTQPYPTPRPNGRRPHGALLSHRRRLRSSQPQGQQLPSHKAALGLRGPDPGAPPAAQGRRERVLVPQRCPAFLLSPVPWRGWASSFLLAPKGAQAQALYGAA